MKKLIILLIAIPARASCGMLFPTPKADEELHDGYGTVKKSDSVLRAQHSRLEEARVLS